MQIDTIKIDKSFIDDLPAGERNGIEYTLTRLQNELPIEGPLNPQIARIGQQIIETAIVSAQQQRTIPLVDV